MNNAKVFSIIMAVLLALPAYHAKAWCIDAAHAGHWYPVSDHKNIKFVVNNYSDRWMYLWMGHPNDGEDNGNLNLKPHSSATAMGCSNGADYAVTGIILTQGKDVLYKFDVYAPWYVDMQGWVKLHTWKGGCYVAWGHTDYYEDGTPTTFSMEKMTSWQAWNDARGLVRIDCVYN